MIVVWLLVFTAFLVLELVTVSLTSVWFAGGALGGLVVRLLGGSVQFQLFAFVAVSFLLLILVRPFAARWIGPEKKGAAPDGLIGRNVVVKTRIDNRQEAGSVTLAGETWLARAWEDGHILEPGDLAVVTAVRGARLFVKPLDKT